MGCHTSCLSSPFRKFFGYKNMLAVGNLKTVKDSGKISDSFWPWNGSGMGIWYRLKTMTKSNSSLKINTINGVQVNEWAINAS